MECTDRRFENAKILEEEVGAWTRRRNRDRKKINWRYDRKTADKKLLIYYV